ncbi:hypothetical protein [Pseudorhodoplanes sp.]|uniref:hypothetical protein n=1 Tax=Pseudorhodoplanes sp. TaxID=1934341 RepID=UPI003D100D5F
MLSVIVYGRNDNFGYNYHKRVSLSLNAFAEHLDNDNDELIFVDYNTSDEFPTLPEAIADTLTARVRSRLRVLRVRANLHRLRAVGAHLDVIEPIARNVGLRRSNPSNRWILSTNADNVLISRGEHSLSAICSSLEPGHYGLPRFEMPEALWELADRANPESARMNFERWAAAARLDEVVHAVSEVGFDNPGDFQLALRTDLFEIDGFDERMQLGWHVDHNLARRLGFRYGDPRSLAGHFKLYHCSHNRQQTATHRGDRTQNDPVRFVHGLAHAELPRQRDTWGCPADDIEDVRLDDKPTFGTVVADMFPEQDSVPAAVFNSASYGNFYYASPHVVPFVLSVLNTHARTTTIGYAGVRRDTFDHLRRGLTGLGFSRRILVPQEMAERLMVVDGPGVQVIDRDGFGRMPDLLVFEFGVIRDELGKARDGQAAVALSRDEESALENVYGLFVSATEHERERIGARDVSARQFLAINAVHNCYQPLIEKALSTSAAPFTTRLRHGYVVPGGASTAETSVLSEALRLELDRVDRVSVPELSNAHEMVLAVIQGGQVSEKERASFVAAAPLVLAYLDQPRARALFSEDKLKAARAYFSTLLTAQTPIAAGASIVEARPKPSERPLSGLACSADWDDEVWLKGARDIVGHNDPAALTARNGWVWERAQILHAMDREALVGRELRALIVCKLPDPIVGAASFRVGALDIADAHGFFEAGAVPERNVAHWVSGSRYDAGRVAVISPSQFRSDSGRYDLAIVPHSAAFDKRVPGLVPFLRRLTTRLKDNATIIVTGEVALRGRLAEMRPTLRMAGHEGLGRVLREHTGMRLSGDAFDDSLAGADLRLVGDRNQIEAGAPCLGSLQSGDVLWPGVWVIRVEHPTEDWDAAELAVKKLYFGEQLPMLRIGPAGEAIDGVIAGREGHEGTVFFGPYLVLPKGDYRIEISLRGISENWPPRSARIRVEAALGSAILATSEVRTSRATETIAMKVRADPKADDQLFEIRCWSDGRTRVLFERVELMEMS